MIDGWYEAGSKGSCEGSAAKWGAGLGGLWALQPVLWLAITAGPSTALSLGVGLAAILTALGAVAGLVGGIVARSVLWGLGLAGIPGGMAARRCG